MGYAFLAPDGTSIWEPALIAGDLYVTAATKLGSHAGMATGLRPNASDMYYIDPAQLRAFVRHLSDKYNWPENDPSISRVGLTFGTSLSWKVLVRPILVLSAVLLERCGVAAEGLTEDMAAEVHELARTLPR